MGPGRDGWRMAPPVFDARTRRLERSQKLPAMVGWVMALVVCWGTLTGLACIFF